VRSRGPAPRIFWQRGPLVTSTSTPGRHKDPHKSGLVTLIGITKLLEALLLLTIGLGAWHLVHRDVAETVRGWVHEAHLDPDGKYLRGFLSKLFSVNDKTLHELGVVAFIYFALHATEGVGLLLHKRWAEYFTVISTSLLVPLEVYEICHKPTATKVAVLVANLVIVAYLIYRLWKTRPLKAEKK
jgi:uncharacterized membrane protein (DUF2068 family)